MRAYKALGCDLNKSTLKRLFKLFKWSIAIGRIFHSSGRKRKIHAVKTLGSIFGRCISKADLRSYVSEPNYGQSRPESYYRLAETIDEIRMLNFVATSYFASYPGILLGLIQFLFYFGQIAWADESQSNIVAATDFTAATVLLSMGKISLAGKLLHEALSLFGNLEEDAVDSATFYINGIYTEDPGRIGDLKLALAYNQLCQGKFQEAFDTYDETNLEVRSKSLILLKWRRQIDPKATRFRIACFTLLKYQLEISRLLVNGLPEGYNRICQNMICSSQLFCATVKTLKTTQPVLFPFVGILVLAWFDFILLLKQGEGNKFIQLQIEHFRAVSEMLCKTCMKGLQVFPSCHRFVKRIHSDMLGLQRKISKSSIRRVVDTTKCLVGDTVIKDAAFLTESWRARVLAKIVRLLGYLDSERDRVELIRVFENAAVACSYKLAAVGMDMEAGTLRSLRV
ncbi:hypothetical protein HDU97_003435 [Phlyctochytrium planicorne]|nr:hypothetical protein HDU97_003435 [Phlyctochytrium planicorne]